MDEVARDEGEGARVEGVQVVAQGAVVAERVTEMEARDQMLLQYSAAELYKIMILDHFMSDL